MKIVIFILFITIPFLSLAKKVDVKLVHQICSNSSVACLTRVNFELALVKEKTSIWYELKLWKLDSLFELAKFRELFEETSFLVEDEVISEYFKIRVLIYHTKLLELFNYNAERDRFRGIVEETLVELHENFSDPSLIIDLVNLQLYSDMDPRVPYHMLRKLEKKFKKRHDPKFKFDLYNNLGHFASRMEHHDDSVIVREQALIWAKRTLSDDDIAEAHFNLARSLQLNKDYGLARQNFLISLDYFEKLTHQPNISLAKLYIAWMHWYLGNHSKAKAWFNKVNLEHLSSVRIPAHKELKLLLKI